MKKKIFLFLPTRGGQQQPKRERERAWSCLDLDGWPGRGSRATGEGRKKKKEKKNPLQTATPSHNPTNNALLINFLLSSDAEIFVDKHRLSMQIGAESWEKKPHVRNVYVFRLSFHFLHATRCWLGTSTLQMKPTFPASSRRCEVRNFLIISLVCLSLSLSLSTEAPSPPTIRFGNCV